nr:hypothetical protein [Lacticaseibacillus paracasei]
MPKAIKKQGVDIRVAIPFYEKKFPAKYLPKVKDLTHFTLEMDGRPVYVGLKTIKLGMSRTISLIIGSILIGMACTVTGMTAAGLVISKWP